MKAFFLSALLMSSVASAQTTPAMKAYSSEALDLLNIASHCPKELSEISAAHWTFEYASHEQGEDRDVYTLVLGQQGFAPNFETRTVGNLLITKSFQPISNPAPDAPGGQMVYNCRMARVK